MLFRSEPGCDNDYQTDNEQIRCAVYTDLDEIYNVFENYEEKLGEVKNIRRFKGNED